MTANISVIDLRNTVSQDRNLWEDITTGVSGIMGGTTDTQPSITTGIVLLVFTFLIFKFM